MTAGEQRGRVAGARVLAGLLAALALLVNPATVAYYTLDGVLSAPATWAVVAGEALALVFAGVVLVRLPRWSANAAMAVIAGVLAAAACEVAAAWTGFLLPSDHGDRRDVFYKFQEPDLELGFRLRADLHQLPLSWSPAGLSIRYDTDSLGFRNAGRDYAAADVFILGDSFAYGVWVEREQTFYGRLESMLGRSIVTLGVGGYGFAQYRVLAERFLRSHHPKVMAVCVFGNDLEAIPTADHLARWYDVEGWSHFAQTRYPETGILHGISRVVGARLARGEGLRRTRSGLALYYGGVASQQYMRSSEHEQVEAVFAGILASIREHGVTPVFFTLPSKESAYKTEYLRLYDDEFRGSVDFLSNEEQGYARLCALAREANVDCVDLTPAFRRRAEQDPPIYFADDGHWNTIGHELAAGVMRPVLEAALERHDRTAGAQR